MASSTVPPVVPPATTPLTTTSTTTTTNSHQNQNQIPLLSNLPPQPTLPSSLANNNANYAGFNSKKRSLDYGYLLQSSPYFKMRVILKELRPLFLEVLRAPDFQKCEAAGRIQEKLKLMVDLCRDCRQQTAVKVPVISADRKSADQPTQERRFPVGNSSEKPMQGTYRFPGTYIVGGSSIGWNFITFLGTKPEYYGRTKEAFRAGK